MNKRKILILLLLSSLSVLSISAATFVVTNTNNSGAGSLRQAILDANLNPGLDTINFAIPGVGPFVITPATNLPTITDPVFINGYSQAGSSPNTNPINAGNNATLLIVIQGPGAGFNTSPVLNGLRLGAGSDGSTIQGLVINNFAQLSTGNVFSAGIRIDSGDNIISGNIIGTDPTGTSATVRNIYALRIVGSNNIIGGITATLTTPENARNLLAGTYSTTNGVIRNNGNGTIIIGNTIGLNKTGTANLMSDSPGGICSSLIDGVTIGGPSSTDTNVIAGHSTINILLSFCDHVTIQGNFIGANVAGTQKVNNNGMGLIAYNSPVNAPVTMFIDGNLISGNTSGVRLGENCFSNSPIIGAQVTNNKIGTDVNGTTAIPNTLDGIWVKFAENTYIAGNTISGNLGNGLRIGKAKNTNVKNNFIGTDSSGVSPLGNGLNGIQLGVQVGAGVPAFGDVIGGAKPGEGNIISNNVGNGIKIISYTQQETIMGNTIENNTLNGILINPFGSTNWLGIFRSAGDLLLVGDLASQGDTNLGPLGTSNIIVGNGQDGIKVVDSNSNTIQSNRVANNTNVGIELIDSSHTLIGALDPANSALLPPFLNIPNPLGNVITDNGSFGVTVDQETGNATDNSILSNQIVDNNGNGIQFVG